MSVKDDRIAELDAACDRAHERIVELEKQNDRLRVSNEMLEYQAQYRAMLGASMIRPLPGPPTTFKVVKEYGSYTATYRGEHKATGHYPSTAMRKAKRAAKRYDRVHGGRVKK